MAETGLRDGWQRLIEAVPTGFFWYTRLSGILSLVSWVSYGLIVDLLEFWALRWLNFLFIMPSVPVALMWILLSMGVRRRKKAAWRILMLMYGFFAVVSALGVLSKLLGGNQDPDQPKLVALLITAVLYGSVVGLLVAARGQFTTVPDRANRRMAAIVFSLLLIVTGGIGTVLVTLTDTNPKGGFWTHPLYVLAQTVLGPRVTGAPISVSVPLWVDGILWVLGTGLLLITLWALFKPGSRDAVLSPEEEIPARALLAEYGDQDSLGYFALRRDKDFITAPNGKAGIAYRVEGSVSLASGDPLGDPESWDQAIEAWLGECRNHAWIPGAVSVSERGAHIYRRHGFDALELGDEAIIDLTDFNLDGREMRQVRQAVRRVERAGYTVRIRRHSQIPDWEMAKLIRSADAWRGENTERGFSMALGRLGDPTDGRCVMLEAFDAKGELRGLLSFVPWGRTGLSLDLMRRDRSAENGLNEFMVAKLAERAATVGAQQLSLNFAMLRAAFERGSQIGAGPIARVYYRMLSFASKFWQLESLYISNSKYNPHWYPRFICYMQSRDLVRLGLAYARAEGFVPSLNRPKLERVANAAPPASLIAKIKEIEEAADAARAPQRRLSEQERVRHAKLAKIREAGMEPYPLGFERTDFAADIRAQFAGLEPDVRTGTTAAIAGRVVLARQHGGLIFVTMRDETADLQVMLTSDALGTESLQSWKSLIDLGDQVGVRGEVVTSKRGELSLLASDWRLTAKCLRPLPNKRSGLSDPEAKVRQRYVDFIVNDDSRNMLRMRGDAVAAVRDGLRDRGYLEVETPMLQPIHGGATARPFTTRINAYNMQLYLRIAPELYLKRLLVGGVGKVFELNRNFRNEGVSQKHNPEFTMLEAYEPYGDYDTMAELTRDLVVDAAKAALGTTVVVRDGVEYDLAQPWQEITVYGSVSEALGEEVTPDTPLPAVHRLAEKAGLNFAPEWGQGKVVQELFEALVEEELMAPTFVRDYPAETSPLTRPHRDDPRLAEKWDLIVFGLELGTAYSELIDPVLQRQRLTEQSLQAAGGDPEAMELDEDFLRALEYAMPPAGGMGMGIDRLLITLTGRSIRETIPFPLVRPGS
ncbi:bifunctional lysylphosphatidylglycerol synthetase/lysine--tRNA ligase LysX [Actinomadura rudentiformis]|uniref:Lysine--tRNA ligase n=1 Tax=Actinomadura rudentiformis TaxID=359158 RepID=A0A6H9YSN6_9ACTN|nr:bifunctional lysylphosphatidylglycerol synthetase/lysine--tRNA ligase LysX [Actinomadura rudentiformis]KAB2351410.1 bifunctional lysylphosphatidylglycerol synthetase/lysine--tRNA ligase LysX [Actinomadura rudentiformis]